MKRSRIGEILQARGLTLAAPRRRWFGERPDPAFAAKRGRSSPSTRQPPADSVVICLDEMGPESAKSFPGRRVVPSPIAAGRRRQRATQEIDYGRRGSGYVFGAFVPATGRERCTQPYPRRTIANWVDFLERVEAWLDPAIDARLRGAGQPARPPRPRCAALGAGPSALGVRLPADKYAAYLNLIEPWWKVLRSLALKGRRFETWEEVCQAVAGGDAVLERPSPSLRLGSPPTPASRPAGGIAHLPTAA